MAYTSVTVTSSATLIVPANNRRRWLIIDNQGSVPVHIGPDASITTSNSPRLLPGERLEKDGHWYGGAIYGITTVTDAKVVYWEQGE